MAKLADLNISIGVETKQLISDLAEGNAELKNFAHSGEASIKTLDKAYQLLEKQQRETLDPALIKKYNAGLKELGGASANLKRLGTELPQIRVGAQQAGMALQGFGRIAQDAAFGPMAIANNLEQPIQSFIALRKETGSTGGAIKALIGSMSGPQGLLFAVSGVTAALSFAQMGMAAWTRFLGNAKEATEGLEDRSKKLRDTINDVVAEKAKEVTQIRLLVNEYGKENTTRKEKTAIIKELQRMNPAYFGSLDAEKTKVGELTTAYNSYNNSIQNAIKAKVFSAQLEDLIKAELQLRKLQQGAQITQKVFQDISKGEKDFADPRVTKARVQQNQLQSELNKNLLQQSFIMEQISALGGVDELMNVGNDKVAKIKSLSEIIAEMRIQIQHINEDKLDLGDMEKLKEQIRAVESALLEIRQSKSKEAKSGFIQQLHNELYEYEKEVLKVMLVELPKKLKQMAANMPKVEIPVEPVIAIDRGFNREQYDLQQLIGAAKRMHLKIPVKIEYGLQEDKAALQSIVDFVRERNKEIAETLKGTYTNAFASIGEAIGNSIMGSGNVAREVFAGLFKVLAAGIKQIGQSLIALGTAKMALEKFTLVPGAVSIAAGVATIAIGSILEKSLPSFATGGKVTGPTLAMVGDNPSGVEYMIPKEVLDKMGGGDDSGGRRIVGVVRGRDLLLIEERASATQRRNT